MYTRMNEVKLYKEQKVTMDESAMFFLLFKKKNRMTNAPNQIFND